jgi:hypothetical protein
VTLSPGKIRIWVLFGRAERWVENTLENVFKSLGAQHCNVLIWDQAPGFAGKNPRFYLKGG